jgi:hypothetical protein
LYSEIVERFPAVSHFFVGIEVAMYKFIPLVALFAIVFLSSCIQESREQIFSGGSGVKTDPYQISNLNELRILSENHALWDSYFILTADIDAKDTKTWNSGKGFNPIGYSDMDRDFDLPFRGGFNGNGHIIKNLYINRDDRHAGFFGLLIQSDVGSPWIENLGLVDCEIHSSNPKVSGAGLVVVNKGYIRKCFVTGLVDASSNIGGLVGSNKGYIENCYAICQIHGKTKMGGLIGYNESEVINCYAIPKIIESKYSDDVGGLIGYNNQSAKVLRCAWDREFSKINRACGRNLPMSIIRGAKTKDMKIKRTFIGWDFDEVWQINTENNGYPSLKF